VYKLKIQQVLLGSGIRLKL